MGLSSIVSAGGDAAVIRLRESNTPNRALALSMDANSLYVNMEPYLGTVQTVAEGMRNLAASGARPIGIATCLNLAIPTTIRSMRSF